MGHRWAALPGRDAEFAESLRRTNEYVLATGAPRIHLMAGVITASNETTASFLRRLRMAGEHFGEKGLQVLIEPINPFDVPGYFLASFDQAMELIKAVDLASVRLQFDAYHCQRIHGDVEERFKAVHTQVAHVQIASAPDRAEPDHGDLDHVAFFALLDHLGYAGAVGCEYHPRAGTAAGLGWRDEYGARSRDFQRNGGHG